VQTLQPARIGSRFSTTLLNGALFNISWLAIVTVESPLFAPAIVYLHLALHFSIVGWSCREATLIGLVACLGVVLDNLLFRIGVFTISGVPGTPPAWMLCLWPVLATTLLHVFSALRHRVVVAVALGTFGGALSYAAGTRLTEVDFFSPLWGAISMGVLWAILFPSLLVVAAGFDDEDRGHVTA